MRHYEDDGVVDVSHLDVFPHHPPFAYSSIIIDLADDTVIVQMRRDIRPRAVLVRIDRRPFDDQQMRILGRDTADDPMSLEPVFGPVLLGRMPAESGNVYSMLLEHEPLQLSAVIVAKELMGPEDTWIGLDKILKL